MTLSKEPTTITLANGKVITLPSPYELVKRRLVSQKGDMVVTRANAKTDNQPNSERKT